MQLNITCILQVSTSEEGAVNQGGVDDQWESRVVRAQRKADALVWVYHVPDIYRDYLATELLPEPETPVTQINPPNGISTSAFFRLF